MLKMYGIGMYKDLSVNMSKLLSPNFLKRYTTKSPIRGVNI